MKVWRYAQPNTNGLDRWFVAFVDDAGCIAVLSDYGNYAYRWGGVPESEGIRHFLARCERSDVLDRFTYEKKELDEERTRAAVTAAILERRRGGWSEADDARAAFDRVNASCGEHDLLSAIEDNASEIGDAWWELCAYGPSAQAEAFMNRVWPRLVGEIKSELDAESGRRIYDSLPRSTTHG